MIRARGLFSMIRQESESPEVLIERAKEFGVDLTMLQSRLHMTPTERMKRHQMALRMVLAFKEAGERKRRVRS